MAGILYFASGTNVVNDEKIADWGLSYAFEDGLSKRPAANSTPNEMSGVVFGDTKRVGDDPRVDLENQVWRQLPAREGRPELWAGFYKDNKPQPVDLHRKAMLKGVPWPLVPDGPEWQIPIVRKYDGQAYESALPCYVDIKDGKPCRGNPLERYAWLWDATQPLADAFLDDSAVSDEQLLDGVVALVKANYVVDLSELVLLQALPYDAELLREPTVIAVRLEWLQNMLKKKQPQPKPSTTSDGDAD